MIKIKAKPLLIISLIFGILIALISFYKEDINITLDENILAIVNENEITKEDLEKEFQSLPKEYQERFKHNKEDLLDSLIIEELLYQQAENLELNLEKDQSKTKSAYAQEVIKYITRDIEVSEAEKKEFYNNNPNLHNTEYEELTKKIESYLMGQRKEVVIRDYLYKLKEKAEIIKNEKWLEAEKNKELEHPITALLKNGKPTVLDLGSSSCVPCKMMKPIFEELEKEYQNQANIILVDIGIDKDLAYKYQIRAIPTQIFFDKKGEEVWRHEGFLAKEQIVEKLEELGVKKND